MYMEGVRGGEARVFEGRDGEEKVREDNGDEELKGQRK